jgi:putative DNA primase/helicase
MKEKFTAEELAVYKQLLEKFSGTIIKNEQEAVCLCPAHNDTDPSLGIDIRKNGAGPKILLRCRSAECSYPDILRAAGLSPKDLHFNGSTIGQKKPPPLDGCYLEEYAEAKRLPVEFLTSNQIKLSQATYYDKNYGVEVPAIYIPYADVDGDVVAERFRVGLKKNSKGPDGRFRWAPGDQPILYGLHRLEEAREAGHVLLVEGESDCHVAWFYGKPAVGIPGVNHWKDPWAEHLDGIPSILAWVESDTAGQKLWKALSKCPLLEGRLRKVVA